MDGVCPVTPVAIRSRRAPSEATGSAARCVVAAAAVISSAALAHATVAGPDPKVMALTAKDVDRTMSPRRERGLHRQGPDRRDARLFAGVLRPLGRPGP